MKWTCFWFLLLASSFTCFSASQAFNGTDRAVGNLSTHATTTATINEISDDLSSTTHRMTTNPRHLLGDTRSRPTGVNVTVTPAPRPVSSRTDFYRNLFQRIAKMVPDLSRIAQGKFSVSDAQLLDMYQYIQSILSQVDSVPKSLPEVLRFMQSSALLSSSNSTPTGHTGGLKQDLKPKSYSLSWPKCQADLILLFDGLRKRQNWASSMLDASGKPGRSIFLGNLRFMGNYLQCADLHYRNASIYASIDGNICRAVIKPTFDIPGTKLLGVIKQVKIDWDICLPRSCQGHDLNQQLAQMGMGQYVVFHCTQDLNLSDDIGAILALVVLGILGGLLLLGTLTELLVYYNGNEGTQFFQPAVVTRDQNDVNESSTDGNNDVTQVKMNEPIKNTQDKVDPSLSNKGVHITLKPVLKQYLSHSENSDARQHKPDLLLKWQRVLLAFSVPRNTSKIFGVKASPGSIGCLHGIRVLSMSWVILGHIILFTWVYENPVSLISQITSFSFQIVLSAPLSVDSFFLMSGLLTCYMFMKECSKAKRVTIMQGVMYYVHRYWRLTPPLAVWIMVVANLLKYIGEGRPAWADYGRAQYCRDNWWINLLYINNVYKHDEPCVGVSWFLAHDMQFYVVAPIALIPWAYGKKLLGFTVASLFIGIHLASTIWIEVDINGDILRNRPQYADDIYFKPYTRVAPFAIGLMLGWFLWKVKGRVRMNKRVVVIGWLLSLGLILTLTLVTYDENKYKDAQRFQASWSHAGRIVFETLKRPLWALTLAWMILACSSGYGGPINSILSWEGWLPLSRLTYATFLVHQTIIMYEGITPESTFLYTNTSLSYHFLGTFAMSYAVAFILAVSVEAPMLALEKVVLSQTKKGPPARPLSNTSNTYPLPLPNKEKEMKPKSLKTN